MYSVVDTHCPTTFSLILPGIFERIVDMNLHERGKGFVEREREKEMTKYLGKCLMFLSFLDRFLKTKY